MKNSTTTSKTSQPKAAAKSFRDLAIDDGATPPAELVAQARETASAEPKPKRERRLPPNKRANYLLSEKAVTSGEVGSHGKLLCAPAHYSYDEHAPLKRKHFEDETHFWAWRANTLRARGNALIAKALPFAERARELESAGNAEQRKALSKVRLAEARLAKAKRDLEEKFAKH